MNTEHLLKYINKRLKEHPQHRQNNLVLYPVWVANGYVEVYSRRYRREEGGIRTFFIPYRIYGMKRALDLAGMALDKIFILQDADSNITKEAIHFIKTRNKSEVITPYCEVYEADLTSSNGLLCRLLY